MLLALFVIVGVVFGFLGALIAFLITYEQYRKHRCVGWPLWREPLVRGLFAFAFFFLLAVLLGYTLPFALQL